MKASDLQPPSTFYRMIEAQGERALIDSFLLKRPSLSERMAAGKALRKQVPRSAQAMYETRPVRPDPIDILKQQDATRTNVSVVEDGSEADVVATFRTTSSLNH